MLNKILISEEEKNEISSSYDDIDRKLMNLLLRRVSVNEKQIGDDNDEQPIKYTEIRFDNFPGYGFTTFMSKKDMERSIFTMLYENDVVEDIDEMDGRNPERVKIVKTIRQFLNFILPKK